MLPKSKFLRRGRLAKGEEYQLLGGDRLMLRAVMSGLVGLGTSCDNKKNLVSGAEIDGVVYYGMF